MLRLLFRRYRYYIGLVGALMLFWSFGYFTTKSLGKQEKVKKCLYISGYPTCYYFLNAVKLSGSLDPNYSININRVERGEKWTEFRNSIKKVIFIP